MFNNVDGKGFSVASKEIIKVIKELKPILWCIAVGFLLYAAGDFVKNVSYGFTKAQNVTVQAIGKKP